MTLAWFNKSGVDLIVRKARAARMTAENKARETDLLFQPSEGDVSLLPVRIALIPPLHYQPNKARSHGGKEKEEALLLRGPHNQERWNEHKKLSSKPSHSHHLSVVSSFQNKQKNNIPLFYAQFSSSKFVY